jgi:hypothetical protein
MSSIAIQLMQTSEKGTARLVALHDVQSAIRWIAEDLAMADTCNLVDGGEPVSSMTLNLTDESPSHTVTVEYELDGTSLIRNSDGQAIAIARNVSNLRFSRADNLVTITIESTPSNRWDISKETTATLWLRSVQ